MFTRSSKIIKLDRQATFVDSRGMNFLNRLFNGRINRRTYGVGLLFIFISMIIGGVIFLILFNSPNSIGITLILLVPFYVSLERRRFHDIGNVSFWETDNGQLVKEGEKKENKYGKPPEPKVDIKGLFGIS